MNESFWPAWVKTRRDKALLIVLWIVILAGVVFWVAFWPIFVF